MKEVRDLVDLVDLIDYAVNMNAEVLDCEAAPAPPARTVRVAVEPRLRGIVKVIFDSMQKSGASSRQELLKAAIKQGCTKAELDAALNYLLKTPILTGSPRPMVSAPAKAAVPPPVAAAPAFDPEAAGEQLVAEMQAAEGGAWTGQELQGGHFQLTPATLHRRRKEHRIIYWRDARHNFHYPKWQFTPGGALLPGIQEVLALFQSQDEWRIMSYFLGQRSQLDELRPLDLLRHGDINKVLAHAQIHAEENTW
jgi:hypothetical protein